MTDQPPSLWREDEGTEALRGPLKERGGPATAGRDVFESSTTPPAGQPEQTEPLALWREDEGKPTHATPLPADASETAGPRRNINHQESRIEGRLFSWRLVIGTMLVLLLIATAADAVLAVMNLESKLETVRDRLQELDERLADGDLEEAAVLASGAASASADAGEDLNRPSYVLASLIPEVSRETETLDGAVAAAGLATRAADAVVDAASTLQLDEEGVPQAVYIDGQVQLETVATAREQVNEAELALVEAVVLLEGLDPRLEQLRQPIADTHKRLSAALARTTRGRTFFDLLPSLLGANGERAYLLAFQAPGEARGTGGLVGLAGVLKASDGRLELGPVVPYLDFAPTQIRGVEAPEWFEQSYGAQQALSEWPQANVSPNHQVVSEVLLGMYEEATGTRLDGVLTMDPIALAELMKGMQPIQTKSPKMTVDASNVTEVLLRDSYTQFETPEEQNVFLRQVVDGFWSQVAAGEVELEAFAEGLGEAIRTQHLKIFSVDRGDQAHIEELDLDGSYDTLGPATQVVFNVNYAANKVDYFLQRELDTQIDLEADGSARVTTTVTMENSAPAGPPSALLGANNGLEPGVNRMTHNVLMPPGSVIERFQVGGEERSAFTYTDDQSPVAWDIVQIDPGAEETVTLTYSIPGAVQILGERTVFDFVLFPQATVNPDSYSLTVTPPPGVEVVDTPGLTEDGQIEMSGVLDEPMALRMQMEPQ